MIPNRICSRLKLAALILALPLVIPAPAYAANCDALWQEAKNTRALLTQRDLLATALKKCAEHAGLHYQYGYSLERLRHYSAALDYYRQAVILEPGLAKAWFGQGDVALLLGDHRQAVSAYEQGLALTPDNERGKRSLVAARAGLEKKGATGLISGQGVSPRGYDPGLAGSPPPVKPGSQPQNERSEEPRNGTTIKDEPARTGDPKLHLLETTVICFRSSSEELSAEAKAQLEAIGQALASTQLEQVRVEVGGHTDNQGPLPINMALSQRRAEVVVAYLTRQCQVAAARLIPMAYGPTQPYAAPSNENNRLNRRVQFKPLPAS